MDREQIFIPAADGVRPSQQAALLVGGAVTAILVISGMVGADPLDVVRRTVGELDTAGWIHLLLLLLAAAAAIVFAAYAPRARLHVGPGGVTFHSGFPKWVQKLERRMASWSAGWPEVESVEVRPIRHTRAAEVLIVMKGGEAQQIMPQQWRRHRSETINWDTRFANLGAAERTRLIDTNPLLRCLAEHGYPARWIPKPRPLAHGTDLTESSAGRVALAAFVLLLAYGFIDAAVVAETYAGGWPWHLLVVAGLLVAASSLVLLWRFGHDLGRAEKVGLAVMIGLAGGVAAYPGLLRVNMLTDRDGLAPYEYVLRTAARLEPRAPGLPVLYAPNNTVYWVGQGVGSTHTFYMRRGMLPFWQYDSEHLVSRMRIWFDRQRNGAR